jgi:excisionase family DNA binding protein
MTDDKSRKEEMLSTSDVGKMLGVTSKTVIRMIEGGQLPGYRVNFVWKVRRGDVETYLEAHRYRPDQHQQDDD